MTIIEYLERIRDIYSRHGEYEQVELINKRLEEEREKDNEV